MTHDVSSSQASSDDIDGPSAVTDTDRLLHLLSHPVRRHALGFLAQQRAAVSSDELYDYLVIELGNGERDAARRRVEMGFYHCHRPKLAAGGLVKYSPESDTIQATSKALQLQPLIESTLSP